MSQLKKNMVIWSAGQLYFSESLETIQGRNVKNLLTELDLWICLSLQIPSLKNGPHSVIIDLGESSLTVRVRNNPGLNILHVDWK